MSTRARDGRAFDPEEFVTVYSASLGELVAFFRAKGIRADEADDLAHETVLRTMVHLKRHGRTQDDIGPLTRTIARNLAIERLRRAGPALVEFSDEIDAPDESPDPSELALQAERQEAVREALASLSPRHRRVIQLWMQGMRPAEIAREFGIKRNAADAILHRARRTLASRLGPRSLWGGVVLVWLRTRQQVRATGQALAAWSPDSAALAPTGVAVAAFGLVAVLNVGSHMPNVPNAPAEVIDGRSTSTVQLEPVARNAAQRVSESTGSVTASTVPVPTERDIGIGVGRTRSNGTNFARTGVVLKDDGTDDSPLTDLLNGMRNAVIR